MSKQTARIEGKKANGVPWTCGFVTLPNGSRYDFVTEHYDAPSQFGIDGGRISKLSVWRVGSLKGVAFYDGGWGDKPKTKEAKAVLSAILEKYN